MTSSLYSAHCDRYIQRTDDSKSHKLKSAYWTTKQAVLTKLRRKQDENIVASDSDLDAKLELLKSVQLTCRGLDNVLARYQRTICYLSQAENEMGRFLKQYSLEDKTQAGKIMSAVGKTLSSSAQQRLTLLNPLDRVHQEVRTFRQRAISDTAITIKRMEHSRTEYRGALLWMKNVSEELDPDTFKQLEKFRCVQAQVRKAKASFDRLKVDSMQKVDLLAASRCNMLSHALVSYQDTLLTFLEKTSHMMVAVAESFKGYQYYEFSILRHLRPESRKLAGYKSDDEKSNDSNSVEVEKAENDCKKDDSDDEGKECDFSSSSDVGYTHSPTSKSCKASCILSSIHSCKPTGYEALKSDDFSNQHTLTRKLDNKLNNTTNPSSDDSNYHGIHQTNLITNEEELDKRLDDIFHEDHNSFDFGLDQFKLTGNEQLSGGVTECDRTDSSGYLNFFQKYADLLNESNEEIPAEHRDLFTDLFLTDSTDDKSIGRFSEIGSNLYDSGNKSEFSTELEAVFKGSYQNDEFGPLQGVESKDTFASHLLGKEFQDLFHPVTSNPNATLPSKSPMEGTSSNLTTFNNNIQSNQSEKQCIGSGKSLGALSNTSKSTYHQATNLDAWLNFFSDLGPIGNPDKISKKDGQITDA
ncbi:Islet cell autoantigen 1 [Schistosoma japonicum]|nr:Islet cell autoantigen 1 [Schistosoma japonicum]